MTKKLIVGPEVALQFFETIQPGWELFEAKHNGDLDIGGYTFSMRVGLHMQRPVQAIMCAGQFIKIRSAGRATGRTLKVLDPAHPNKALYHTHPSHLTPGETSGCWHPAGSLPEPKKPVRYDSVILDEAPYYNWLTDRRRK